jgi:hypothetical protein
MLARSALLGALKVEDPCMLPRLVVAVEHVEPGEGDQSEEVQSKPPRACNDR